MKRLCLALLIATSAISQRIDQLRPPGGAIISPVAIRAVGAEYTPEARAAGLQGTVSLYADLDADGNPSRIKVLHGLGLGLDEKALQAVQQWQFKPATRDNQPIELGRSIRYQLSSEQRWTVENSIGRLPSGTQQQSSRTFC